ncbi:ash family protein [Glaesserella sp.]|uniref:ash family protein n=2 Tax=Glaesserella TaxID=2094023 RepID=UPI00359F6598
MKNHVFFQKQKQSTAISAKMQEILRLLLTTQKHSPYAIHAFAKSEAEPRNSNLLSANNSTPLTRAFFIRCTRTPKENALSVLLSMVACSGKGSALCCLPIVAVFEPVARYRPISLETEAIAPTNQLSELSAMIYKFLLLGKNRLTIRIRANSEAEARQRLQLSNNALCIARFNDNLTACNQVKGGIYA